MVGPPSDRHDQMAFLFSKGTFLCSLQYVCYSWDLRFFSKGPTGSLTAHAQLPSAPASPISVCFFRETRNYWAMEWRIFCVFVCGLRRFVGYEIFGCRIRPLTSN
mgnify:CR=1 FL=1